MHLSERYNLSIKLGWHQMVASDGTYSGSTYFDPITNTSDWLMNTGDGHSPRRINAELNGYAFFTGEMTQMVIINCTRLMELQMVVQVTNFSNGTELSDEVL